MKHKIGDRVRVREDLEVGKSYGNDYYFAPNMAQYKGQVVTISRVGDDFYKIKGDIHYWSWTDEMFEEIKMKYKVGDKVRVRTDLIDGETYSEITYVDNMDEWAGKVVTISYVGYGYYEIAEDESDVSAKWAWSDEMFEDVVNDENQVPTDGKVQTVDVGYYLTFCGHRVLVDVYQDGNYKGKPFFTSADGFNQYILPKDAIEWVVPHGE